MSKLRAKNPAAGLVQSAASTLRTTVGRLGSLVSGGLDLAGLRPAAGQAQAKPPGSSPGIENTIEAQQPPPPGLVKIQCIDYAPGFVTVTAFDDIEAALAHPRAEGSTVRWLNIDGLHPYVVRRCKEHFKFHTLAAEDTLHVPQRPKVEAFEDHLFLVVRMLMLHEDTLGDEQISLFVYGQTLITFQQKEGDVWDPIRQRLQNPASRLRQQDAGYLLYALLDAVVDHCFPILERIGDLLEELEGAVLDNPVPAVQHRIHGIKRQLILLRRVLWPMRELVNELVRDPKDFLSDFVQTYLRDVYDHSVQVLDIVETYREMAGGLNDLYMSAVSNRMNEIMKVLTIMASFFIPVTFVAGVYGMNFEHMPELKFVYSYPLFWVVCGLVSLSLFVFFYRKGWLGKG
jgi:magnesium transporter